MIQCFSVSIDLAMPRERDHFTGSGDALQVEVCTLNLNGGNEKAKRMKLEIEKERA